MKLRFTLHELFTLFTVIAVFAALVHGSLYYPEPIGVLSRIGVVVFGILLSLGWRRRR